MYNLINTGFQIFCKAHRISLLRIKLRITASMMRVSPTCMTWHWEAQKRMQKNASAAAQRIHKPYHINSYHIVSYRIISYCYILLSHIQCLYLFVRSNRDPRSPWASSRVEYTTSVWRAKLRVLQSKMNPLVSLPWIDVLNIESGWVHTNKHSFTAKRCGRISLCKFDIVLREKTWWIGHWTRRQFFSFSN